MNKKTKKDIKRRNKKKEKKRKKEEFIKSRIEQVNRMFLKKINIAKKHATEKEYNCMEPNCNKKPIQSHTLQRKRDLHYIQEDKQVITFTGNSNKKMYDLIENRRRVYAGIEKTKRASTVTGYCHDHDRDLFRCIEQKELVVGNEEQIKTFWLRSLMREFAQKREALCYTKRLKREMEEIENKNKNRFIERFKNNALYIIKSSILGIEGYMKYDYPEWEKEVRSFQNNINYTWYKVNSNLGIALTSGMRPWAAGSNLDREILSLQNHSAQPTFFISIIPRMECTHIIIGGYDNLIRKIVTREEWLKTWFAQGLRLKSGKEKQLTEFVNRILTHTEDTCIRPSLWNRLLKKDKSKFYSLFENEILGEYLLNTKKAVKIVNIEEIIEVKQKWNFKI